MPEMNPLAENPVIKYRCPVIMKTKEANRCKTIK